MRERAQVSARADLAAESWNLLDRDAVLAREPLHVAFAIADLTREEARLVLRRIELRRQRHVNGRPAHVEARDDSQDSDHFESSAKRHFATMLIGAPICSASW